MSYFLAIEPHPTIEQLKARRAECLMFALAMHRRILRAHPADGSVIEWRRACRYWIEQAYHAHGELLAQLAAMPPINRLYATAPMPLPC